MSLSFIRSDLLKLNAYTANPHNENPDLIRLDANESPLNLPTELKVKLASFYEEIINTNRYPDGSHWELKNLIRDYVNESVNRSIIDHDNISVGNGSDELIRSILIATCLNQSGSILVANPTFSMYAILAESLGISVISIPRNQQDFTIDLKLASQAINSANHPPIKVIFMVHPNSPTANCLTETEINWLKQIPDDILVVIDEAYYEFSQQTLANDLKNHPNWLILRTFSKAFRLAAHRVGYAISSSKITQVLDKIRLPYNLPTFSQLAVKIALENQELILPMVKELIREKERVYQVLSQNNTFNIWRSDANFIYLQLKDNPSSEKHEQIRKILEEKNILIRHTGGGLRITIGTETENNYLLKQLQI